MSGGELFNRIQERQSFNERGEPILVINVSLIYTNFCSSWLYTFLQSILIFAHLGLNVSLIYINFCRGRRDSERYLRCCQVPPRHEHCPQVERSAGVRWLDVNAGMQVADRYAGGK